MHALHHPKFIGSNDCPYYSLIVVFPSSTTVSQLKAALVQGGVGEGLESVKYVKDDGKKSKKALASYNSMKNALVSIAVILLCQHIY